MNSMTRWIAVMFLGLGVLCSTSLNAQPKALLPTDRAVSLRECIDCALKHHNNVLAAESDVEGSKANVRRARSGFMPKLTASSTRNIFGSEGDLFGTGINSSDNSTDSQTQIGVRQTILDGGRTRTSIRQSSAAERASIADLDRVCQERILAVTVAYFDVLKANRLAEIAAQSVKEAEGQRGLIQARIDAKDAAKVDIYPVEVQLANAKLQKLQADNTVKTSRNNLANAIGLASSTKLQLSDVEEPAWTPVALQDCLDCAIRERPELVRSAAQLDSAKAGLSLAKLQRIPVPTASISYDRGIDGTRYDNQWSVGLGLSMNLFDGGAVAADEKNARESLRSTELRGDQLLSDISKEVEEAYLNLQSSLEQLEASKSNVALAQTNLEVANEKYKNGLAIPLEVVSAQVSNADAKTGYAQALYNCYVSKARLEKAMGRSEYESE